MYIHIHIKKKKRVVWVRRDLFKDYPVPTPCHGWGHLPPDQVEIFSCMCMCSPGFITFKTELVIVFNNKQYSDLNFFSRVLSQKKKKLPSISFYLCYRLSASGTCLVSLVDWVRGVKHPLIRSLQHVCNFHLYLLGFQ